MAHQRYRLLIAYQGQPFCGWQVQPSGTSIQGAIQQALGLLTQATSSLIGAGRTDAGVHARGQVAHIDVLRWRTPTPLLSLNALLPKEIRILQITPVEVSFHARYHANYKIYHYDLHTAPVEDPFLYPYRWYVGPIDQQLLHAAAQELVGRHDFKALANSNHQGVAAHDSMRTLYRVDVTTIPGGIRFAFIGDGFLYKMVRNCVGLLLEVARGSRPKTDIGMILGQQSRERSGHCAPAQGLCLHHVSYTAYPPTPIDATQESFRRSLNDESNP